VWWLGGAAGSVRSTSLEMVSQASAAPATASPAVMSIAL
jgi:hypothetical protein